MDPFCERVVLLSQIKNMSTANQYLIRLDGKPERQEGPISNTTTNEHITGVKRKLEEVVSVDKNGESVDEDQPPKKMIKVIVTKKNLDEQRMLYKATGVPKNDRRRKRFRKAAKLRDEIDQMQSIFSAERRKFRNKLDSLNGV